MVTKSPVDLTGALLGGRYRVVRRLGVGGMGSVYEAVTGEFERRVAVKVLHAELANDEEIVQRFKREARAAAALDHPHIVQVTDFVAEPGKAPFLVMEYLVGQSLHDVLKRQKHITPERAARIAVQVLSALAAAHSAKIIHRDIKPDNIFLTSTAAVVDVVKVLDFGVAKLLGDGAGKALTVTGVVIGTLSFMAPEQALGKRIDVRADIYALAATIYFAVSGRKPLDGPNPAELLAAVVGREPRSLKNFRIDVDTEFDEIIATGLKKNAGARYQTAEAMEQAFQRWLEQAPQPRGSEPYTLVEAEVKSPSGPDVHAADDAPTSSFDMPTVGGLFGRYEVKEHLGSGGVGEVFRAEDAALGRAVALKVLRTGREAMHAGLTSAGAARILREARAAATLDHPNAVSVFDVGTLGGISYLVMELVQGKTLRTFIGDANVAIERKIGWLMDIARALAAAHKKGVVHQDIKPENVMLRDDDVVKVLDFGIARRLFNQDLSMPGTSSVERIPGTPAYMAPEQMHGASGDALTDQFAWGVVAYELLTGDLPWKQHGGVLHIVNEILTRIPEAPSRRAPEIPEGVDEVVLKALSKDPADRYSSMDEMVAALGAAWSVAAEDEPPVAHRPRWTRRALAALACAAASLVVWAIVPHVPSPAKVEAEIPTVLADGPPDFGSAMSPDAEAVAAYRAGVQAVHDGAVSLARASLDKALLRDPSFAPAHLRRVLTTPEVTDTERASFLKATQLRDALSEHDRALLHVIEPWVSVPQNTTEVEQRLVALTSRQRDADYFYQLCRFRVLGGNYTGAIEACRSARDLDPRFAGAFWLEGLSALLLGDAPAGNSALHRCLELSPKATSCLNDLVQLSSRTGACEEAHRYAETLTALDPENYIWLQELAKTTYAIGKPIGNVRDGFQRSWEKVPVERVPEERARARTSLAVLTGDFDDAVKELDVWDRAVERSNDEPSHQNPFRDRAFLEREMGQEAQTVPRARSYLGSRAAWTPAPQGDGSIDAMIALYRGGALAQRDFAARRNIWLAQERERPELPEGGAALRWLMAYANAAVTAADARDALAALPEYQPLPPDRSRNIDFDESIGATYLMAGDVEQAIPFLRRAAASCGAAFAPFHHTWANLELGEALEASDPLGACKAYKIVLGRWGSARQSRSANRARDRWRALGCR